jgi:hypothetical protein
MGFANALGGMMGMKPPIQHIEPTPERYPSPISMAPSPSGMSPTTQPLLPQGTNINPILREPMPDVRETPARSANKSKEADKVSGMSVGI